MSKAMSAHEAADIVSKMRSETPMAARVRLMQVALRIGKLSEGAKDVYRNALKDDGARP